MKTIVPLLLVVLVGACENHAYLNDQQNEITDTQSESETDTNAESTAGTDVAMETGLRGQYFNRYNFKNFVLCLQDDNIDFDWSSGGPEGITDVEALSVRWEGWITPDFSETYTFRTISDDGVRLWVDNTLLIDDWFIHHEMTNTGTIDLTTDVPVKVVLEYFNLFENALVQLSWESLSLPMEVIPAGKFTSTACGAPPELVSPDPVVGTCLQPDNFDDSDIASVWRFDKLGPAGDIALGESDGTVTITVENGYEFNTIVDAGAFLSQAVTGDADVSFRIDSITGSQLNEMGLMMRNTLEADAEMVFIGLTSVPQIHMYARDVSGEIGDMLSSDAAPSLPYWVRITRTNDLFEGYVSADGVEWQLVGSATVPMNETYLTGIAQSSGLNKRSPGTGDDFIVNVGSCK